MGGDLSKACITPSGNKTSQNGWADDYQFDHDYLADENAEAHMDQNYTGEGQEYGYMQTLPQQTHSNQFHEEDICTSCKRTVAGYPDDAISSYKGALYHTSCMKCASCRGQLTIVQNKLYCPNCKAAKNFYKRLVAPLLKKLVIMQSTIQQEKELRLLYEEKLRACNIELPVAPTPSHGTQHQQHQQQQDQIGLSGLPGSLQEAGAVMGGGVMDVGSGLGVGLGQGGHLSSDQKSASSPLASSSSFTYHPQQNQLHSQAQQQQQQQQHLQQGQQQHHHHHHLQQGHPLSSPSAGEHATQPFLGGVSTFSSPHR